MLYPIFDLNNWFVGGPYNQRVGACFQAQHGTRLAAIRIYLITQGTGYAAGTGGRIKYELCADNVGQLGTVLATGYVVDDPEYPEWVNAGGFPLIAFPGFPLLVKGQWYHLVLTNEDAQPTANYISVDFAYAPETTPGSGVFQQNPDPTMWAWYWPAGDKLTRDNTVIPTPIGIYYANGNMQGNGGYQVTTRNTVPLCWKGHYAAGPC